LQSIKKSIVFLVYTNLFIASCAVALGYETFVLLQFPVAAYWYLLLLALSTLFIYNLHYYVKSKKKQPDPRLVWSKENKQLQLSLIVGSSLLIAIVSIIFRQEIFTIDGKLNFVNIILFITVPLVALGYSHPLIPQSKKALRQNGWLKLVLLSFVWAFTTTTLPTLMISTAVTATSTLTLFTLFFQRFFFVASLCVLFNVNDYEEDKADGIKTIAVAHGAKKTIFYAKWGFLLLNIFWGLLLLYYFDLSHPAQYISVLIPAGMVWWLYQHFSTTTDEALFVLRYDGMMIVKALLLIFAVLTFN
jgi:4-hydroxybenzoate polyprenyltransferase